MKTKIRIFAVLFIFFTSSLAFNSLKAQTFNLSNALNCDVVIGYEIGDGVGACNYCGSGSQLLVPGASFNLNACGNGGGFSRACIWIISIDGVSVTNSCHNDCGLNTNCCTQVCPGDFIPNTPSGSACVPGSPYTISFTPGIDWRIF